MIKAYLLCLMCKDGRNTVVSGYQHSVGTTDRLPLGVSTRLSPLYPCHKNVHLILQGVGQSPPFDGRWRATRILTLFHLLTCT